MVYQIETTELLLISLPNYNPGRATISSIATIKKIDQPGCNVYGLKGQQNSLLFFEEKIPLI